jgi:hypothetical protein
MNALRIGTYINSRYTGMMGVGSGEWGVGESGIIDIDFIIPMQPETILGIAYWYQFHPKTGRVETPAFLGIFSLKLTGQKAQRLSPYRYPVR